MGTSKQGPLRSPWAFTTGAEPRRKAGKPKSDSRQPSWGVGSSEGRHSNLLNQSPST